MRASSFSDYQLDKGNRWVAYYRGPTGNATGRLRDAKRALGGEGQVSVTAGRIQEKELSVGLG
jgi:hypothetical protein